MPDGRLERMILMKKLLIACLGAAALLAFTACGSSAPVKDAVSASTDEQIADMTFEKAAGTYELTAVNAGKSDAIAVDSYTTNVLVLTEDGSYTLTVVAGTHSEHLDGSYTLSTDGALTLLDGSGEPLYLASVGEKAVCDGEKIVASGSLGTQGSIVMEYTKDGTEEEAE